jgi:hypothetical protein
MVCGCVDVHLAVEVEMKKRFLACALIVVVTTPVLADENEWFKPLGQPPKASPKRISGGESFPPLPLPATPLRRSERKREPSPPKLIGKVMWGETAQFTYDTGHKTEVSDWNLCPADIQQLVRKAGGSLGAPYSSEPINLTTFDADPQKMPVIMFSGARSIRLDPKHLETLRTYVLRGGTILADNVAGSPYFYASFKKMMEETFPESSFRILPADHPIYHIVNKIDRVRYGRNNDSDRPHLEAIYIGCRTGVLLSKYGMGTGWDDHDVPMIQKAVYYDVPSANALGVNIVAYILGYANVGREESKPEMFGALDEKRPTDEFVFAQIKHEGHWNVHPGSAAALLRRLRANTAARVSLKRMAVTPGKDDLSSFTFLYLTGLDNFQFDGPAATALRNFLNGSGTLLINNGLGLKTFDVAVRRELKKILPEAQLEVLSPTHPIFSSVFRVNEAQYTPAVWHAQKDLRKPYLEGITINGDLRVIYSPFDIEAGWSGCDHPLARAFESETANELGINIVMYSITH